MLDQTTPKYGYLCGSGIDTEAGGSLEIMLTVTDVVYFYFQRKFKDQFN